MARKEKTYEGFGGVRLSRYGYHNVRQRDMSLSKSQRRYSKSFTAGANFNTSNIDKPIYDWKGRRVEVGDKRAFRRGQVWQTNDFKKNPIDRDSYRY